MHRRWEESLLLDRLLGLYVAAYFFCGWKPLTLHQLGCQSVWLYKLGFQRVESKEWNLQSISSIIPLNVLSDIKAILIPSCPLCDRIFWGSSQDGKSTLKSATWAMRKPLMTLDPNYYIGFGNYIYAKFKILLMANYSKSLPTCEFVI